MELRLYMDSRLPLLQLVIATVVLIDSVAADLKLLQWNPHWQCFVWNQKNCAEEAKWRANALLLEHDVDFANLIEFDELSVPSGWNAIESPDTCGHDRTMLVYNAQRWSPNPRPGSGELGCMVDRDRPFVLQVFDPASALPVQNNVNLSINSSSESRNTSDHLLSDSNSSSTILVQGVGIDEGDEFLQPNMNSASSDSVAIVAAHFPHPMSFDDPDGLLDRQGHVVLKAALERVIDATGVTKVVLIADTNEYSHVSSPSVAGLVGIPGDSIISTSLERTCCFDNGFHEATTFDRIIANFGAEFGTTVLFSPVPEWGAQVKEDAKPGAFHKAVLGVLRMTTPKRKLPIWFSWHFWAPAMAFALFTVVCLGMLIVYGARWTKPNRYTNTEDHGCMTHSE